MQNSSRIFRISRSNLLNAHRIAFSDTYLNNRKLHEEENVLFEGPVKMLAKSRFTMLDRFAVLCPSRLLIFNHESKEGQARAIFPIISSEFSIEDDVLRMTFTATNGAKDF